MADSAGNAPSLGPDLESAVRIDDLRLSLPPEVISGEAAEVDVEGVRLTVSQAGVQVLVRFLSQQVSTISRERVDGLLATMDEHPRLRPVRWYYASLFRVVGLRDELAISGILVDGGIEIRARFAQAESGNLLRQWRDRARNLATVTARLHLSAVDGALHVRLDLTPDVNKILVNLVLNGMGARPGLSRVDATSVRIDPAEAVAAAVADRRPRPRMVGRLLDVQISPEQAVFVLD
jgi:hypothetical protein